MGKVKEELSVIDPPLAFTVYVPAVAMPVTAFVQPGPAVVTTQPSLPV